MKKISEISAVMFALSVAWCLTFATFDSYSPSFVVSKRNTYAVTLHVAGNGGHIARAEVVIDPSTTTRDPLAGISWK